MTVRLLMPTCILKPDSISAFGFRQNVGRIFGQASSVLIRILAHFRRFLISILSKQIYAAKPGGHTGEKVLNTQD